MLFVQDSRVEQSLETSEKLSDSNTQSRNLRNFMPGSALFLLAYLLLRVIFLIFLSLYDYTPLLHSFSKSIALISTLMTAFLKLIIPIILLILLLRRRFSFLKGIVILAVLDDIALLQILQPLFSIGTNSHSISALSCVTVFFCLWSIFSAIYANKSSSFRKYCSLTPSLDRKKLLDASGPAAKEDVLKLVGIRGWLGLFAFSLIAMIVVTIAIMVWSWGQMQDTTEPLNFGDALSTSMFLGLIFYIFPLITLIRLFKRRLDFRNSYITGVIIDLVMVFSLMIAPDGRVFRPIMPMMLIGMLLAIIWVFYLFRSKRVLLSCPNGKPEKPARIDGQKWRKLY